MKSRLIPVLSVLAMSIGMAYPAAAQVSQGGAVPAVAAETATQPSAAENLKQVKEMLTALQAKISSTMASLDALKKAAKEGAGLEQAHQEFAGQYQALDAQLSAVRQLGVASKANAEAYFQNWQQAISTIENKDIKETATDRFNKAKARYAKALAVAEESRQKVQPFMVDLKDINTFLNVDLTADSVKSLSNTTWRLGRNAEGLVDAIADVNKQVDIVLESLPNN